MAQEGYAILSLKLGIPYVSSVYLSIVGFLIYSLETQ